MLPFSKRPTSTHRKSKRPIVIRLFATRCARKKVIGELDFRKFVIKQGIKSQYSKTERFSALFQVMLRFSLFSSQVFLRQSHSLTFSLLFIPLWWSTQHIERQSSAYMWVAWLVSFSILRIAFWALTHSKYHYDFCEYVIVQLARARIGHKRERAMKKWCDSTCWLMCAYLPHHIKRI